MYTTHNKYSIKYISQFTQRRFFFRYREKRLANIFLTDTRHIHAKNLIS